MNKTIYYIIKKFYLIIVFLSSYGIQAQTAYEIMKIADNRVRGNSSYAEITITIVRPKWQKKMSLKSWSKGNDYSVSLVKSPAKEKGTVFLKRKKEAWNYLPTIERTIKLPPSMMTQNWMGTDFTNDDLVKQSSMVVDYTHKIIGSEIIEDLSCWKLELLPNEQTTVVWGKLIVWIDKSDYMQLKTEFYDEDLEIVNRMVGSEIREFNGKKLPSKLDFYPLDDPGNKTIIEYDVLNYGISIPQNYFSIQYVSRLK
ncbi:MAG: outer membrane lipoprotein-sorting protein [Flavobacteriaceae bacterium]|nr:outer membrane lipoprotein-sorting protein [Flavobacteriaceae bacterium]|tara:strand:+ start:523 stop:1287 length:765 start_codon:yes stop_codon:yes gene_type:complete